MEKRTIQVNIRVTEADEKLFSEAAVELWPGAEMTRPAIILSLARAAAERAVESS